MGVARLGTLGSAGVLATLAVTHLTLGDGHVALATVHGGIGWWLAPALPLAGVAWWLRSRHVAVVLAAVAVLHLTCVLPGHRALPCDQPPFMSVGTANVLAVNPTRHRLAKELRRLGPDIWSLQEVDPQWARILDSPAFAAQYPHRWIEGEDSAFGAAILSRWPITEVTKVDIGGGTVVLARIHGLWVVNAHTEAPRDARRTARWAHQMAELGTLIGSLDGAVIVASDLNATRHHPSYQRLVDRTELQDAHAHVGRASAWTWPAPPYWDLFPKLRLDHVMLSAELQATAVWEGNSRGSDHLPVVVEVARRTRRL